MTSKAALDMRAVSYDPPFLCDLVINRGSVANFPKSFYYILSPTAQNEFHHTIARNLCEHVVER